MQVISLNTRQSRIYKSDIVPFRFLSTKLAIDFVTTQFRFRESAVEGGELVFVGGSHVPTEQAIIVVNAMSINERRIVIDVAGTTQEADILFSALRGLLAQAENQPRIAITAPLIVSHETECVAEMEIDWRDLVSDQVAELVSGPALRASEGENAGRIAGMALRFTFAFTAKDASLAENSVSLSDKRFIIEPRTGVALTDHHFYTASPLDTDSHIRLLEEFEKKLRKRTRRRSLPPAE
jgi:hypothetical protein